MSELQIDPPMTMFICGSSGSGKTVLLRHLLNHTLRQKYDNIFIMATSLDESGDYDEFKGRPEYKNKMFGNYDPEIIEEIFAEQGYIAKKYGKERTPNTLLILDDCLDALQGNHNLVQKIFWKGRHRKLSCIVLVQKLKGISTLMRINTKYMVFFRCGNSSELDNLLEEYTGKRERHQIQEILVDHFKLPWSFLFCDLKTQDFRRRYQLGADKKILGVIEWC